MNLNVVTVNGKALGGTIHELKPGVALEQAFQAGKKDGLDQVYFQAEGKNYVLQGDGLDIKALQKKGDMPFVQLHTDKGSVLADVKAVDNEKNTFMEGGWNWGTKGALALTAAAVGLVIVGGAIGHGDNALGMVMSGMTIAPLLAGGAAVTFVGGGAIGALKGSDQEKMMPLLKP
ncbi:MAG: hypothetical protein IV090_17415 [Candidatus Sericytochromatia bacterium]|nr:hypothetical protein [Candidatus Sericytochromatia bacterium]